ncbi:TIGR03899 family protein [Moritella sp. 5]|uniref:TIGR03899 family protein n=1 Tax=Moritella sp. 5 TaxID=2746231 RepID=UPI001BAB48D6|nr:TIGR03899 family protein [Moritella sp. 5]QUM82209.1 TIGR03899 family protein [Moritella sp. 5]
MSGNDTSINKVESNILNSIQQLRKVSKDRGIDGMLTVNKHTTFEHRAIQRLNQEKIKQQQNLESIVVRANNFCDDVTSEVIDPDWLSAFMSMAKDISGPHMQTLWGKIFALELSHSGSFSVKSLRTLNQMTQREAQMFQSACNLSSQVGYDTNRKIILNCQNNNKSFLLFNKPQFKSINLGRHKLPYSSFLTLSELGLIHNNELEMVNLPRDKDLPISYGEEKLTVKVKSSSSRVKYYRFTHIGDELAKLIPHENNHEYFSELTNHLHNAFYF